MPNHSCESKDVWRGYLMKGSFLLAVLSDLTGHEKRSMYTAMQFDLYQVNFSLARVSFTDPGKISRFSSKVKKRVYTAIRQKN